MCHIEDVCVTQLSHVTCRGFMCDTIESCPSHRDASIKIWNVESYLPSLMMEPQSEQSEVYVCHVLQCVAVCCSVLQCGAVWCCVLQCVTVCCSVMQYVSRVMPTGSMTQVQSD